MKKKPDEKLDELLIVRYGASVLMCGLAVDTSGQDYEIYQDERKRAKQAIIDYHERRVQEAIKPIRDVQEKYKKSNYDTYTKYKIATQSMNYTFELEEAIDKTIANVDGKGESDEIN
ncbi:hypothetical protein LCGC14_3077850 [marine sediment metagenome]|uniref:Uncharacterized protein n=1 Tax=marine sediment metagenome TaxID=412755 RepID=A0A0F8WE24_9ZZZZ